MKINFWILLTTALLACGSSSGGAQVDCRLSELDNCTKEEFCKFSANCGKEDAQGQCTSKPEVCPMIYAPVCGCDQKTYGSECQANGAGVSVTYEGECLAKAPANEAQ